MVDSIRESKLLNSDTLGRGPCILVEFLKLRVFNLVGVMTCPKYPDDAFVTNSACGSRHPDNRIHRKAFFQNFMEDLCSLRNGETYLATRAGLSFMVCCQCEGICLQASSKWGIEVVYMPLLSVKFIVENNEIIELQFTTFHRTNSVAPRAFKHKKG